MRFGFTPIRGQIPEPPLVNRHFAEQMRCLPRGEVAAGLSDARQVVAGVCEGVLERPASRLARFVSSVIDRLVQFG